MRNAKNACKELKDMTFSNEMDVLMRQIASQRN